jgi:digeranylgeranylglycerophospholipid reductase
VHDRDVDVLVVGAGPTGSTAARFAAAGGARTLLIEKRPEIGTPVRCGEGVAKRWLEEIGVAPSRAFIAHEVDGAKVVAPDGTTLVLDERIAGNETGHVLERDLFDRHLAKEAAKAGADLMIKTSAVGLLQEDGRVVGARCEHFAETFDVRARVVIGADGYESQVGRWAGLETHLRARDIDACLQYTLVGVEGDPRLNEFYLGSAAPGGYAWTFWKGPDTANVGIGVNLSRIKDRADVKRYLDAHIARQAHLAKGERIEEVAGAVSVSLPLERTVAPGLLLAGDAARLIDPLTGGGILNGCLSGKYAGEVAARAAKDGDVGLDALGAYERLWRSRLEEELARHYAIKERLLRIDDATINGILRAVAGIGLARLTAKDVLEAVKATYPAGLAQFADFL